MKEQLLNKVENILAKGKIAHHEKFLLLTQCFQKSSAAEASESVSVGKWVKKVQNDNNHAKCMVKEWLLHYKSND